MKKLLLALIFVLPGCAAIDAFLMTYDANEYNAITDVRVFANTAKTSCDTSEAAKNANALALKTFYFVNYTQYLPHNAPTQKAAVELNDMAQGLNNQYKTGNVSPIFCKIKFEGIATSAEAIQKTVGAKPR